MKTALIQCLAILMLAGLARAGDDDNLAGGTILQINTETPTRGQRYDPSAARTIWRYWETWQSEVIRTDAGRIIRANTYRPVRQAVDEKGGLVKDAGGRTQVEARPPKKPQGSPFPPDGWQAPDFDDSSWFRHKGPMAEGYRGIYLVCLRGKFEVTDPAKVPQMTLWAGFRGGMIAYLNGREIGRAFVPAGAITRDTLAESYPDDVYVNPDGSLINEANPVPWESWVPTCTWASWMRSNLNKPDVLPRYQGRCRRLEIKVPPAALRKGVNVLAIEIRRAPANEIMLRNLAYNTWFVGQLNGWAKDFITLGRNGGALWWNHAMMEDLKLTVPAAVTAVVPNIARPQGLQVWNESTFKRVLPSQYGDPNESLRPVRLRGVRNGTCSAAIVVGSSETLRGLKVSVTGLRGPGGSTIPAGAIRVAYVRRGDALDLEPPGDLEPVKTAPWNRGLGLGANAGVTQPVWFLVQSPRTASVGVYAGRITVSADGVQPVEIPMELKIASQWAVPDPNQFITYMGVLQSPESVAMQYNVPMWSEEHWKRLHKTFELLGEIGNRELYIPLITKTLLGHEHGMVRWIRQADGSYRHDFSIAGRYIDLAVKHKWNLSVVGLHLSDGEIGKVFSYDAKPRNPPSVTVVDPATGALGEIEAPKWGTPEARAFWKPVIDEMRALLEKRGLKQAMMFSFVIQNNVLPETISDLKAVAPDVKWVEFTHWGPKWVGTKEMQQVVGRIAYAAGTPLATFWDPDEDPPCYRWKQFANDVFTVAAPRAKGQINMGQTPEHSVCRLTCESTLLATHEPGGLGPGLGTYRGFGQVGADYWPVLEDARNKRVRHRIDARYVPCGSLGLNDTVYALLAPGESIPAHSCRSQLMRESQQEAEARVVVQDALLDETRKAKLGDELAKECQEICDQRSRIFLYSAIYFGEAGNEYGRVFNQERWDVLTQRLYVAAGKVIKAAGK